MERAKIKSQKKVGEVPKQPENQTRPESIIEKKQAQGVEQQKVDVTSREHHQPRPVVVQAQPKGADHQKMRAFQGAGSVQEPMISPTPASKYALPPPSLPPTKIDVKPAPQEIRQQIIIVKQSGL